MRRTVALTGLAAGLLAVILAGMTSAVAHDPNSPEGKEEQRRIMADHEPAWRDIQITGAAATPCVDGTAAGYPCRNVDLLSVLPLSSIGGGSGSSMWGWTDSSTGKEYIVFGRSNGVAFIDVSTPTQPRYLGNMPSHNNTSSSWRDVKVYKNHAYVGADSIAGHGIQVFDLTRLRTVTTPQTFTPDARYTQLGRSHTIAVNEETGFIYAVGSDTCNGGVHMVDVRTPKQPTFAGCVDNDGYVHENQCVIYRGPDTEHQGREICFNYNVDTLTIVDVTDKANWRQLSRTPYAGSAYTHQGWVTADHSRLLMNDELDSDAAGTKTFLWDIADLDRPVNTGAYLSPHIKATDHNHYVVGSLLYQAAYRGGLRILDITGIANNSLTEVGYFDIYPASDTNGFNGAWNNYPFFASGTVAISGIEQGLVLVKPNLGEGTTTD